MTNDSTRRPTGRRPATATPAPPLTDEQMDFARLLGRLLAERWDGRPPIAAAGEPKPTGGRPASSSRPAPRDP
jgi:hypothetical protein